MKTFNPISFSEELIKLSVKEEIALKTGLDKAAKLIQKDAKQQIGHLQKAVGTFPEWQELAESTKDDKSKKGYFFNGDYNPLLREGNLKDSIQKEVEGFEAVIGSKEDVAAYQEFGTSRIPPRPFIGPAAYKNKEKIRAILGMAAIIGLTNGERINSLFDYDMDI